MATYLASAGKSRWCDKSLSNVLNLEQLASAWPDSRFVLLYRHCMDVVMSGIEASPWGLDSYGFGQFAQMSPTNTVIALVGYWIERTAKMLAFEERFPGGACVSGTRTSSPRPTPSSVGSASSSA